MGVRLKDHRNLSVEKQDHDRVVVRLRSRGDALPTEERMPSAATNSCSRSVRALSWVHVGPAGEQMRTGGKHDVASSGCLRGCAFRHNFTLEAGSKLSKALVWHRRHSGTARITLKTLIAGPELPEALFLTPSIVSRWCGLRGLGIQATALHSERSQRVDWTKKLCTVNLDAQARRENGSNTVRSLSRRPPTSKPKVRS